MSDQKNDNQPIKQPKTVEFRGGGFAPKSIRWVGFLVFVLLIALMEIGTQTSFISNLTMPKPSDVFQTFVDLFNSGLLWEHLLPSLSRLAVGATLGVSFGIVIGVLIGYFHWRGQVWCQSLLSFSLSPKSPCYRYL